MEQENLFLLSQVCGGVWGGLILIFENMEARKEQLSWLIADNICIVRYTSCLEMQLIFW